MPEEPDECITLKQAARLAGFRDVGTLYRAVREGRLQTVPPEGSTLLTTRAWLEAYLTARQGRGSKQPRRAAEE